MRAVFVGEHAPPIDLLLIDPPGAVERLADEPGRHGDVPRQSHEASVYRLIQRLPCRLLYRCPGRCRLCGPGCCDGLVAAAAAVEDGDPLSGAVITETHAEALMAHPDDYKADTRQQSSHSWMSGNSGASAFTRTAARAARRRQPRR